FAISEWEIEPDIITLGKAIGSGYAPLAAMVVSDKICQALSDGTGRFVHGLTYSGTPSACFVGLKVHEIMRREGLFTRPASIGRYLKARLGWLAARHATIGEVRGKGLLFGIELVADRKSRTPFAPALEVARRVVEGIRARGIIITAGISSGGFGGDQLQIS